MSANNEVNTFRAGATTVIGLERPWRGFLLVLVPFFFLAYGAFGLWLQGHVVRAFGGFTEYNLEPLRPIRRQAKWLMPLAAGVPLAVSPLWHEGAMYVFSLVCLGVFSFVAGLTLLSWANDAVVQAQREDLEKHPDRKRLTRGGNVALFLLLSAGLALIVYITLLVLGGGHLPGDGNPVPGILLVLVLGGLAILYLRSPQAWLVPDPPRPPDVVRKLEGR